MRVLRNERHCCTSVQFSGAKNVEEKKMIDAIRTVQLECVAGSIVDRNGGQRRRVRRLRQNGTWHALPDLNGMLRVNSGKALVPECFKGCVCRQITHVHAGWARQLDAQKALLQIVAK